MKSLSLILASLFCAGTPAIAEEQSKPAVVQTQTNSFQLGKDVVKLVRTDYTAGKYNEFLKEMDRDYLDAKKSNELEGLIEIRKETAKVKINPEFAKSYRVIQDAKNKDLLNLATDNTPFDQKIRTAATSIADMDEHFLNLSYKAPGTGKNSDENAIIEIGLEYYYKTIHLDSKSTQNNIADRKEKHMALEMQKMDRLMSASKTFSDKKLKDDVATAAAVLDERMAKSYDMSDLLALGKGRIKPATSKEEKAAAIVSSSQGDLAQLHRQLLNSLDNDTKK